MDVRPRSPVAALRAPVAALRGFVADAGLRLSPEYRAIARIIRDPQPDRTSLNIECDGVFVERLERNPHALCMGQWESHFEWRALFNDYPEVRGHLLDFGCGSGQSDVCLARRGRYVHGIDASPIGIRIASYYREREPPHVRKRLSFELADITQGGAPDAYYDACWSSHVFEHIREPGPVIAGIRRRVKDGGLVLISVPFERAYDDPGHVNHFYGADELAAFLQPHIAVVRVDLNRQHQVLRAMCRNTDAA